MPSNTGMILKNPLPNIEHIIVIANVTNATEKCVKLYLPSAPFIAMLTAVCAKARPITITTGPTTIGGSNFIIHSDPDFLIPSEIKMYTSPASKPPSIAAPGPPAVFAVIIGAIKANDDPR
ncbi:Uncharacterised protein [Streptococcus pneumoniae]|nr:Uncharacterised protein [Streptococcus pneumoniae]CKF59083.1 Uncharacterised protein [Streptococcus pneumoniae]